MAIQVPQRTGAVSSTVSFLVGRAPLLKETAEKAGALILTSLEGLVQGFRAISLKPPKKVAMFQWRPPANCHL